MREALFLGSVAGLYLPVLLSPGPNFLVLTRVAVSESRRHGLFAAFGVSSASVIFAILAVTGMGLLVTHTSAARVVLQIAGGGYLLYVALRMIRRASLAPREHQDAYRLRHPIEAYRDGLLTNLTNPHAMVFFTSVFAALLSTDLLPWAKPAGVVMIGTISISINLATVMLFSIKRVQENYLRAKPWIDRVSGVMLGLFGLKLMLAGLLA